MLRDLLYFHWRGRHRLQLYALLCAFSALSFVYELTRCDSDVVAYFKLGSAENKHRIYEFYVIVVLSKSINKNNNDALNN